MCGFGDKVYMQKGDLFVAEMIARVTLLLLTRNRIVARLLHRHAFGWSSRTSVREKRLTASEWATNL